MLFDQINKNDSTKTAALLKRSTHSWQIHPYLQPVWVLSYAALTITTDHSSFIAG